MCYQPRNVGFANNMGMERDITQKTLDTIIKNGTAQTKWDATHKNYYWKPWKKIVIPTYMRVCVLYVLMVILHWFQLLIVARLEVGMINPTLATSVRGRINRKPDWDVAIKSGSGVQEPWKHNWEVK
jgi:hypothetical protein